MKKYVDGEYVTMTQEEIAESESWWAENKVESNEATEADYQSALAEFGVKV